ncbi:DUF1758 domain-containing protein [Trichonephila clavata]|uniref:DUF1758 domain-containing protein n=1 Tax=Trichonephila clavata TaxID=2740835 RepID=A0A8X6KS13_TRICU|nr:DUF1758 domain-containing protein [Trichonephila clavata]
MAQSDLCPSQSNKEIHVLIGADLYWQFHTGCIKRINKNLFCVETIFGWTSTGNNNLRKNMDSIVENLCFCEHQSNCNSESYSLEDINSQMRKIWEIDNLGITDNIEKESSEVETLKQFEQNIKFKNGSYEVKLPFQDEVNMTSNFHLAKID